MPALSATLLSCTPLSGGSSPQTASRNSPSQTDNGAIAYMIEGNTVTRYELDSIPMLKVLDDGNPSGTSVSRALADFTSNPPKNLSLAVANQDETKSFISSLDMPDRVAGPGAAAITAGAFGAKCLASVGVGSVGIYEIIRRIDPESRFTIADHKRGFTDALTGGTLACLVGTAIIFSPRLHKYPFLSIISGNTQCFEAPCHIRSKVVPLERTALDCIKCASTDRPHLPPSTSSVSATPGYPCKNHQLHEQIKIMCPRKMPKWLHISTRSDFCWA
jgi:hypothetical protein